MHPRCFDKAVGIGLQAMLYFHSCWRAFAMEKEGMPTAKKKEQKSGTAQHLKCQIQGEINSQMTTLTALNLPLKKPSCDSHK